MFIDISSLELVMMVAIIMAGALLLVFVYQAYQGKSSHLLPIGIVILSVVVIIEKIFFSQQDFLDWLTVLVFAIGSVAGLRMIFKPEERRE